MKLPISVLSGPIPMLPSLFGDGRPDWNAQMHLCDRIVAAGIRTMIVGGAEGEGATLLPAELFRIAETAIGCGATTGVSICASSTEIAKSLARHSEEIGATFLVVSPPPYNKPTLEGVCAHFEAVANASKLPIILRDDSARTKVVLTDQIVSRMCASGHIAAVALGPGSMRHAHIVGLSADGSAQSIAGSDFEAVLGQCGYRTSWLSSCSVVDPARCLALHNARIDHDWHTAARLSRELGRLMRALEIDEPAISVKEALAQMGVGQAEVRLPLVAAPQDARRTIAFAVASLGLSTASAMVGC